MDDDEFEIPAEEGDPNPEPLEEQDIPSPSTPITKKKWFPWAIGAGLGVIAIAVFLYMKNNSASTASTSTTPTGGGSPVVDTGSGSGSAGNSTDPNAGIVNAELANGFKSLNSGQVSTNQSLEQIKAELNTLQNPGVSGNPSGGTGGTVNKISPGNPTVDTTNIATGQAGTVPVVNNPSGQSITVLGGGGKRIITSGGSVPGYVPPTSPSGFTPAPKPSSIASPVNSNGGQSAAVLGGGGLRLVTNGSRPRISTKHSSTPARTIVRTKKPITPSGYVVGGGGKRII